MDKYTFLDFAEDTLKRAGVPLTSDDIWEKGHAAGFDKKLSLKGRTPWATLGARLYVDIRDNPKSRFYKADSRPTKFWLRSQKPSARGMEAQERPDETPQNSASSYNERELHPLLTYFAYSNMDFNNGHAIYTKTIFHEKSSKGQLNEWVHPDIVGVYIPIGDWEKEVLDLTEVANSNPLTFYSFEMKKQIAQSNYREYFFQAVSNSSWANEGYLVAPEIKDDEDLKSELARLSQSFGIGVIKLDLESIDDSHVILPARKKKELDWETINKLAAINPDFKGFIKNVKGTYTINKFHRDDYDKVYSADELENYMRKHGMLQNGR